MSAAVSAGKFLDEKYHIHIIGFGSTKDKELLLKYKTVIEGHNKYDDKLRERIEHTLNELSNKKEINIDCLID